MSQNVLPDVIASSSSSPPQNALPDVIASSSSSPPQNALPDVMGARRQVVVSC